jgi:hypothetical protein
VDLWPIKSGIKQTPALAGQNIMAVAKSMGHTVRKQITALFTKLLYQPAKYVVKGNGNDIGMCQ